MNRSSYMPRSQADAVAWSQNFVAVIGPTPLLFGITADEAQNFARIVGELTDAWAVSQDPATRTKITIRTKDTALKAMKQYARYMVGRAQSFPSLTDTQREQLQITIRKTEPARPAPPTEAPVLNVLSISGRTVKLKIARTDGKRGRPAKALGTILYVCQAETPDAENVSWSVLANTGKNTLEIPFPPSETTDTFWIMAQYYNGAKESGPLSTPVRAVLVAQGLQPSILSKSEPVKLAA